MKKYAYIFLALPFLFSCSKDVEPDLASDFVGNYYLTEQNNEMALNTVWKITKKDENHVDVLIEGELIFKDNSAPKQLSLLSMPNVLVEFNKVLAFDNEFKMGDSKGTMKGTGTLTGDVLSYSVTLVDDSGSELVAKKLYRR